MQIRVRVKPGASRTRVGGRYGEDHLVVAVSAPAVDGRANDAVCRALAAAFGLRPRQVTIVTGVTARNKLVSLNGDAEVLARRVTDLLEA
ncbi:DUF167 domain-containing protein [Nostocoides australiense]